MILLEDMSHKLQIITDYANHAEKAQSVSLWRYIKTSGFEKCLYEYIKFNITAGKKN